MSFLPEVVYKAIEAGHLRSLPPEVMRTVAALPSVEVRLPEVKHRPLSLTALLSGAGSGANTQTLPQSLRGAPAPLPAADCAIPEIKLKRPGRYSVSREP